MVSKTVIIGASVAIVIVLIIVALVGAYFAGFNAAQLKDEKVMKLGADVDTQMQRRFDLIPNLVESAKGYMQFEKDTLVQVTQLRSQWQTSSGVDKVATGNQLEATLSKLILTYEQYPELKSDATITRLMDDLAGSENRISVARIAYNDGVREYNIHLRTFPNNVFNESGFIGLGAWDMQQYEIYQTTDEAKVAPKVDLDLN